MSGKRTADELKQILDKVNEKGKQFCIKMNTKKTKGMVVTRKEARPRVMKLKIDEYEIAQVDSFMCLGQLLKEERKWKV